MGIRREEGDICHFPISAYFTKSKLIAMKGCDFKKFIQTSQDNLKGSKNTLKY